MKPVDNLHKWEDWCCSVGLKYSHTPWLLKTKQPPAPYDGPLPLDKCSQPFTWDTLSPLVCFLVSLHHSDSFPHQWQLQHNWPVASPRQIGLVLCPIHTQKSPTMWDLLCRKMDHPSQTPLPSSSPPPPTQLRNGQYLVSQPWWGETLCPKRRSLPESRNQPCTRLRTQYTTVRHKKSYKGLRLMTWDKQLRRKPTFELYVLHLFTVQVEGSRTTRCSRPLRVRTFPPLSYWCRSKLCNCTLRHNKGLANLWRDKLHNNNNQRQHRGGFPNLERFMLNT